MPQPQPPQVTHHRFAHFETGCVSIFVRQMVGSTPTNLVSGARNCCIRRPRGRAICCSPAPRHDGLPKVRKPVGCSATSERKRLYNTFVVEPKKRTRRTLFLRLSIVLLAATLYAPLSATQMRAAAARPFSGAHGGFARRGGNGFGWHHGRRPFASRILVNSAFLDPGYDYSDYYSDYDGSEPFIVGNNVGSNGNDVQSASPQVVFVQPASTHDSQRKTKPGPLLIEWRGDRYVRFGGDASPQSGTPAAPDYAEPAIANAPARPPTAELPPAVVVYRDGHREEIAGYTIADGIIYLHGNDWQSGYWTKRIALSALDPLATMRANRQRGVQFMLPSAPNVVIASF